MIGLLTIVLIMSLVGFGVVFTNKFPFSKIHYAAYCGDISKVRSELASGENIDKAAVLIEDGSRFQSTYTPLMLACAGNKTQIVAYLIDSGADLEKHNSDGFTALHSAIESGSFDCTSLLLDNGADANEEYSKYYDTLCIIAYMPEIDPRILDLLLENGYQFESKEEFIDVAIYIAVRIENDKFIHRMLDLGAVPGNWAMREAVREGRVDLLKLFVKHGADLGNYWDSERNIFLAVRQDNNPKKVIKYLIEHGHKIDAQDDFGGTALMLPASMVQPDLCRIFLEFGADPNLRNDDGMSAIDYAIDDGFDDATGVVKVLLEAGAEVRLKDDQGKDRFSNISTEILKLLKEHVDSESKEKQPDD